MNRPIGELRALPYDEWTSFELLAELDAIAEQADRLRRQIAKYAVRSKVLARTLVAKSAATGIGGAEPS